MTAVKTRDIAPALTNLVRIRTARAAAEDAVYQRAHAIADALDCIEDGMALRDALAMVFDAGYIEAALDGPDPAAVSHEMLAALLETPAATTPGSRNRTGGGS